MGYELENKRDGAGKFGRIFQSMIDKYASCHGFGVGWEEPNAPIIDPAPPRTVTDNGDDSYNTNDKLVETDDSYNTNDKLVDAGDSYNTNGKIVDQSTPVTCASPPAAGWSSWGSWSSCGDGARSRTRDCSSLAT